MSVVSYNRSTSKLQVIVKAQELTVEMSKILCSEKFLPKKSRWLFAYPLANVVQDFHSNIIKANEMKVVNNETFKERSLYQSKAYSNLMVFEPKLLVMIDVFALSPNKFEHVTKLIYEETEYLKRWIRTDNERYKQFNNDKQEDKNLF